MFVFVCVAVCLCVGGPFVGWRCVLHYLQPRIVRWKRITFNHTTTSNNFTLSMQLTEGTQGLGVPDVAAPDRGQVGGPQVRWRPVVAGQVGVRAQTVPRVPPGITRDRGDGRVGAGVQQAPVVVRPEGRVVPWHGYICDRTCTYTHRHDLWCGLCGCGRTIRGVEVCRGMIIFRGWDIKQHNQSQCWKTIETWLYTRPRIPKWGQRSQWFWTTKNLGCGSQKTKIHVESTGQHESVWDGGMSGERASDYVTWTTLPS